MRRWLADAVSAYRMPDLSHLPPKAAGFIRWRARSRAEPSAAHWVVGAVALAAMIGAMEVMLWAGFTSAAIGRFGVGAAALVSLVGWVVERRRRVSCLRDELFRRGLCPCCAYDLLGNGAGGTCPECGANVRGWVAR
jgi:hypothetical protein